MICSRVRKRLVVRRQKPGTTFGGPVRVISVVATRGRRRVEGGLGQGKVTKAGDDREEDGSYGAQGS